jgi:hypothetical protein
LNTTASRKFIAPRRQGRKGRKYFSELGALCAFARDIFFPDFVSQIQAKISRIFGQNLILNSKVNL